MTITALPTPPSRQDPDNFAERADLLLAALVDFVDEANALGADVSAKQTTASSAASTATTKAGEAASARDIAMAAANYKGLWSALSGALNVPATVYHGVNIWMLTQSVASVAAEVPGVSSKWINVTPASGMGSAAYQPASAFQPAIGALSGLLKSAGAGTIATASAADIVSAIGATAVQNATSAASATTAANATAIADGTVSTAAKIGNGIITWGKMVAMSTGKLLGRTTGGAGQAEEISLGTGLAMAANVLSVTNGGVTSVNGVTGAVTAANISAAATSGYNYTPANPANVVPKNFGAVSYPVGVTVVGFYQQSNGLAVGATVSGASLMYLGAIGATGGAQTPLLSALDVGTWLNIGRLTAYQENYDGLANYTGSIFQRIA